MSISIKQIPSLQQHILPLFHNEGAIQRPLSVSQWNPETKSHQSEDDETKIQKQKLFIRCSGVFSFPGNASLLRFLYLADDCCISPVCCVCRLLWFVCVSWCRCSLFILSFLFLMAALVWPAELYLSLIPLGKTNMSAHTVGWNLSYRKTFNSSRRLSSDIFILWLLLRPNCLLETKNFASFIILFPWIALMYFSQPIDGQHALHCCYLNYLKL